MTVLSTKKHIARKSYRCDLCGEIINKGEPYVLQKFVDNNEFDVAKHHENCSELLNIMFHNHDFRYDDEVSEGTFMETVYEYLIKIYNVRKEDLPDFLKKMKRNELVSHITEKLIKKEDAK